MNMSCLCSEPVKNKINSCMDLLYKAEYWVKNFFYGDIYKKESYKKKKKYIELNNIVIEEQPSRNRRNVSNGYNSNNDDWIVI